MRTAALRFFSFLPVALLASGLGAAVPTVVTVDISDITTASAVCGGNVTADGGVAVTVRGACWSTLPNPTIADNRTNDGTGTGAYSSAVIGLSPGTIYYVRAFATNTDGTSYGVQKAFTTLTVLPTVTTAPVSAITATTAASGGDATADGGATITAKGVCWSTMPNPTIGANATNDGSGLGSFVSTITGLTPGTTYYARAYATNIAGTGYGDETSFATPSAPTVITAAVTAVTDTSAACGGEVNSDGGTSVTVRGVCWGTSENPIVTGSKTEDGSGTGVFTSAIAGLTAGTTYYVRAYATNMAGTSYGEQRSFKTFTPFVNLTMAVSGSGTTTPVPGTQTVASLTPITITGTAGERYHFVNWTVSGGVVIAEPNAATTTAILSGDATVTANFAHDTASLSMTVMPTDSGTTTPAIGTHLVNTYETIEIVATPAGSHYFSGWLQTGNATIANASSSTTTATLTGDAIIVANFLTSPPDTAALTMTVSPIASGTTTPAGTSVVSLNVPQSILAAAGPGFYFAGWTVFPTSNATVADASAVSTTVTLVGDALVTANFTTVPPTTAVLTMAITPEGSGTVYPKGANVVSTEIPQSIVATPADGYFFVKWTTTENATVAIPTAASTTVTLSNNAVVTAEFSKSQTLYLAVGSSVAVNASELGDPLYLEFKTKPKIFAAKPTSKAIQMTLVNNPTKQKPLRQVIAEWTKKILLYDKKKFKGVKLSEALLKTPMTDLALGDLFAQTKELYSNVPVELNKQPWLSVPIITDISNEAGVIIVRGRYFGAKAPKILVEYQRNSKWCYKSCAVDKTATYKFKNAKGIANSSCMKVLDTDLGGQSVGYSEVMVTFPDLPKDAVLSGYVILDNTIAMTTVKLP